MRVAIPVRRCALAVAALAIALLTTALLATAILMAPAAAAAERPSSRAAALVARMTAAEKLDLVATGSAGVPRLGVPPVSFIDGPNGIAAGTTKVTAFPAAETVAASFDRGLARRYGDALGAEAAAKGANLIAAPTVNIIRRPLWGREAETFGEDPFLSGEIAAAEVRGIQSNHVISEVKHYAANNQEIDRFGDPLGAAAVDERIGERALREIYYPAFEAAFRKGGAASAMCSYNQINGSYACQNRKHLAALRGLGLRGFVEPDALLAVRDVAAAANAGVDNFQLGSITSATGTPTRKSLSDALADGRLSSARLNAMARAILVAMIRVGALEHPPRGDHDSRATTPAHRRLAQRIAQRGTVLLRNVRHALPLGRRARSIAVIGHDAGRGTQIEEGGSPTVVPGKVSTPLRAIRARARRAGARVRYAKGTLGVVALPIVPASALTPQGGDGHGLSGTYYSGTDFGGAPVKSRVDATLDFDSDPAGAVEPLEAIPGTAARSARWRGTLTPRRTGRYRFSLQVAGDAQLRIAGRKLIDASSEFTGGQIGGHNPTSFHAVIHLRAGRPVPIEVDYSTGASIGGAALHLGWQPPDRAMVERAVRAARRSDVAIVFANDVSAEGMDRPSLSLPGDQDALISAVARANPRTIVVLHTAGPVLMPWKRRVAAIVEAWYPGQRTGAAIAATLFGDVDPAGRLPVTFPASPRQGPATKPAQYPGVGGIARYDEGIFVGYRYYDRHRQRPLYPFGYGLSYTRFELGRLRVKRTGAQRFRVSMRVRNSGRRRGSAVIQLYVGAPRAAHEPPRQLEGFRRVSLRPGGRRTVHMTLDRSSLRSWDAGAHAWRVVPGRYAIEVGTSSRDLPRRAHVTLRAPR